MKDLKEVIKDFFEEYDKNSTGWNYWISKDDEFYDIYLIGKEKSYFLKMDSIYTQNPLGTGTEMNVHRDEIEKDLSDFGFRKFTENELKEFMETVSQPDVETEEKAKDMVDKKLDEEPVSRRSLDDEGFVLLGPFYQGKPFQSPSKEHDKIDKKLRKHLRDEFRKRKPMYR